MENQYDNTCFVSVQFQKLTKKINKINVDYIFWKTNLLSIITDVLSRLLSFSYIVAHTLSIFIHAWDAILPRDSRGLQIRRTKYGTRKILEHEKAGGRRAKIIRRRVRREERENVLTYVGGGESHLDGDCKVFSLKGRNRKGALVPVEIFIPQSHKSPRKRV